MSYGFCYYFHFTAEEAEEQQGLTARNDVLGGPAGLWT